MTPLRRIGHTLAEGHPNAVVITLFVYLTLLGGAVLTLIYLNHQTAAESHKALCAFRNDLNQRVLDSQQFLLKHPHGIPGISRADIQLSIHNQNQTITTLRFLTCPGDTP